MPVRRASWLGSSKEDCTPKIEVHCEKKGTSSTLIIGITKCQMSSCIIVHTTERPFKQFCNKDTPESNADYNLKIYKFN